MAILLQLCTGPGKGAAKIGYVEEGDDLSEDLSPTLLGVII